VPPARRSRAGGRAVQLALADQDRVEGAEDGDGVRVVGGGGAQRVAGQRGQRGGFGTLSTYVAEEEAPPVVVQREQVVEVPADLVEGGGVVVGGGLDAGDVGQSRGEQAALQHGGQPLQPVTVALGVLAHAQQLALVGSAVGGLENHGPDERRHVGIAGHDRGGSQDREPTAVGAAHVQRHPADGALHLQQRREVGLVVDPAADGEQIGEPAPPDQLIAGVAEPGQQGRVDPDDGAVGKG
jgi:hypothetical protein